MPIYYNQNNYPTVPYPSQENKTATIKSGGCGVCTCANVLAHFGISGYDPIKLGKIFMEKGARVNGGTDMNKGGKIICELGNLTYKTTSNEAEMIEHVKKGNIAIANVDGDKGAKGIFSNMGHYINIIGLLASGQKPVIVFDVGYYYGKFNNAYRKQYVTLGCDSYGNEIQYCSQECLDIDTKTRVPSYYLFSKNGDNNMSETVGEKVKVGSKLIDSKVIDGKTYVEMRTFVEAIKSELSVTWSKENGAGLKL